MEKKKTLKVIKILAITFYLFAFVALVVFEARNVITESSISFAYLIYWMILFGWIGLIVNYKWSSSISLVPALVLLIIGALFATVGLKGIAEVTMRISFIGWLVGVIQALIEFRQAKRRAKV